MVARLQLKSARFLEDMFIEAKFTSKKLFMEETEEPFKVVGEEGH